MSCRAALVIPAMLAACGWASAEDQLLTVFFDASRTRDTTRLEQVATVFFEPKVDGSVQRFEIEGITPGARRRLDPAADAPLAVLSLTPAGQPDVDVSGYDVDMTDQGVRVRAEVHTPAGGTELRTFNVTMRRAMARRGDHGFDGRWIVTGIQPAS